MIALLLKGVVMNPPEVTAEQLAPLRQSGWAIHPEHIQKTFQFSDFREAFGFMTQVAFAAEVEGHHPDWKNVYNRVEVALTTHDAGGLTQKDIALASIMDRVAAHRQVSNAEG